MIIFKPGVQKDLDSLFRLFHFRFMMLCRSALRSKFLALVGGLWHICTRSSKINQDLSCVANPRKALRISVHACYVEIYTTRLHNKLASTGKEVRLYRGIVPTILQEAAQGLLPIHTCCHATDVMEKLLRSHQHPAVLG